MLISAGTGSGSFSYVCGMAYANDKERVEGWPLKGTRDKLKAKAAKKGKTYSRYVAEILEKAAR